MYRYFRKVLPKSPLPILPENIRSRYQVKIRSLFSNIRNILNKILSYATKAKRADELKSAFALSLAHDLKSPLAVIKATATAFYGQVYGVMGLLVAVCLVVRLMPDGFTGWLLRRRA